MKKISILLLAAMSCSLAFLSCGFENFQTPKQVKVKTKATYVFPILNFDSTKEDSKFKVSDYFDLGKILEEKTGSENEDSNLKIYKYNNGSQFQQFLVHMPLKEIEFDFSESFKDMDFSKSMQSFGFDKEIEIPDVGKLNESKDISLGNIKEKLAEIIVGGGYTNVEAVTFVTTDDKKFETVTYKSGNLVIEGKVSGIPITGSVELFNGSQSLGSATFSDNKATISLAGKTLSRTQTKLIFTDNTVGKVYTATPSSDTVLQSVTGLTLTGTNAPTITVDDIDFNITMSEDIKSCLITEGTLTVDIPTPTGWDDDIINYTIELSGGISKTVSKSNKTANLGSPATNLSSSNIKAKTNITLTLDNSKINFDNEPKVTVDVEVKKISATVKMPESYETSISKDTDITEDITNYVKRIYWNESGFDVTATNDLPVGNDIILAFESDFFKMDKSKVKDTIVAQGASAKEETYTFRGEKNKTKFVDDGEGTKYTKIDLLGEITLPGYNSTENTITVVDVSPSAKYHLNLSITPALNWEKAEVKMPENSSFAQKMDTGLNKKSLFSALGNDFADKIEISSMPLYLYATIPDKLAAGMKFGGIIKAFYGKDEGGSSPALKSDVVYVLGSDSGSAEIATAGVLPEFTKNADGDVTTEFGEATLDFAKAMNLQSNSDEGSLYLDYNIGLNGDGNGGVTITKEEIEALKSSGKSAIKIDVVVILSLDFKINGQISVDLMEIAQKKDSDILGRTEPTDTSSYDKYLEIVKSAALTIEDFKLPMSGDVAFKVDMYGNGTVETKEIGNGSTFTLEVNPATLLEKYPLKPDVKFVIGKEGQSSTFGLLRTMPIGGKIKIKVNADGAIPIYPFSEQSGSEQD